ncbi:MAG: SnoaL-like domain-containing protein [Cyclobacteriaceae bacterium]
MSLLEKVTDLNNRIQQGQVMDAFETFYHPEVVMQENNEAPRLGKEANRVYEQGFVDAVETWNEAKVLATTANEAEGTTAVEWFMDFTFKGGQRAARRQVCVQKWQDGQIIEEKCYYPEG